MQWWLAAKTFIFTIIAPGAVTVLGPWLVLAAGFEPVAVSLGAFRSVGLIPIALGAAMYVWCAWDFVAAGRGTPSPTDPPRNLVVRGLYRSTRNPMYVGIVAALVGEALWFQSVALAVYALLLFAGFHLRIVLYEEPVLARTFAGQFADYCARVPRWLPRAPRAANAKPGA